MKCFLKNFFSSNIFSLFLIGCMAVTIYCNIFNNPFVLDDGSNIVENRSVKHLASFFTQGKLFEPRAIVALTFALNYKLGGFHVFGYHLVNVLIHMVNGFIVYFLLMAVLRKRPEVFHLSEFPGFLSLDSVARGIALFSALVFITHPIQTQAVTYTVQRYTSMAAMFYFGSMLFYAYARIAQREEKNPERVTGSGVYYGLSILFGMLALLSKQNTASLPAAIILMEYFLFDGTWKEWKIKLPWFVLVSIGWSIFAFFIISRDFSGLEGSNLFEDVLAVSRETETVGRWQYLCTQFNVLVIYIRLLFLPIDQNLDYMYIFKSGFFDGLTPFAFLFVCFVAGTGIYNIKKHPVIAFSILFFFITLSVESSIIPISDAMFEHRLYLPIMGFCFLVAYVLSVNLHRRPLTFLIMSLLVVLLLGAATYRRNIVWQDSVTLWKDVLSKSPHNYRAYNNLGYALWAQERSEDAIRYLQEAIRIKPGFAKAYNNLGIAFAQLDNYDDAIKNISKALSIDSSFAEAHFNKGNILVKQNRLDEAVFHYAEALRANPCDKEIHNNMGNALFKLGETDKAIKHFLEVLKIDPDDAFALLNMGVALEKKGAIDNAVEYFKKAIQIKPNFNDAHYNLGIILTKQGKFKEAAFHFNLVLKIDPSYPKASYNLKKIRKEMGQAE